VNVALAKKYFQTCTMPTPVPFHFSLLCLSSCYAVSFLVRSKIERFIARAFSLKLILVMPISHSLPSTWPFRQFTLELWRCEDAQYYEINRVSKSHKVPGATEFEAVRGCRNCKPYETAMFLQKGLQYLPYGRSIGSWICLTHKTYTCHTVQNTIRYDIR
jgi:hypothetical protein